MEIREKREPEKTNEGSENQEGWGRKPKETQKKKTRRRNEEDFGKEESGRDERSQEMKEQKNVADGKEKEEAEDEL